MKRVSNLNKYIRVIFYSNHKDWKQNWMRIGSEKAAMHSSVIICLGRSPISEPGVTFNINNLGKRVQGTLRKKFFRVPGTTFRFGEGDMIGFGQKLP